MPPTSPFGRVLNQALGIDANGEVGSSLPWVGTGGERCPGTPYVGRWTENGRELYTLAKDYGWKLQNTFGPRRAEQWTWQHPQGGRHRFDYFCVTLATHATPARTIYEAPVACSGFRDDRPLVMTVSVTAWEQHLLSKLSSLTPMQAFNKIEHAVVEVGLQYLAAPSRRGGRRQPTLTSSTLALVRQKQQLVREMAWRRHETWSPLEVEALRANYDEAAMQARTAVQKDKISNLESLARTAEEAHKDRDPRTVYQVIRRLAPPARLPTRTVRCNATGKPCRHKQHEMEEIEKPVCQFYKGTSRPLEWQAPCSSSTTAVWQAPDVAELTRAIKRLPNFKAAPKIFLRRPPCQHQYCDDQR